MAAQGDPSFCDAGTPFAIERTITRDASRAALDAGSSLWDQVRAVVSAVARSPALCSRKGQAGERAWDCPGVLAAYDHLDQTVVMMNNEARELFRAQKFQQAARKYRAVLEKAAGLPLTRRSPDKISYARAANNLAAALARCESSATTRRQAIDAALLSAELDDTYDKPRRLLARLGATAPPLSAADHANAVHLQKCRIAEAGSAQLVCAQGCGIVCTEAVAPGSVLVDEGGASELESAIAVSPEHLQRYCSVCGQLCDDGRGFPAPYSLALAQRLADARVHDRANLAPRDLEVKGVVCAARCAKQAAASCAALGVVPAHQRAATALAQRDKLLARFAAVPPKLPVQTIFPFALWAIVLIRANSLDQSATCDESFSGETGKPSCLATLLSEDEVHRAVRLCVAMVVTLTHSLSTRVFVDDWGDSAQIGIGVHKFASRANHSCVPNAFFQVHGRRAGNPFAAKIRACTALAEGDEVLVAYAPHAGRMSFEERRRILESTFGFDCACELCSGRSPPSPAQSVECPRPQCARCRACGLEIDANDPDRVAIINNRPSRLRWHQQSLAYGSQTRDPLPAELAFGTYSYEFVSACSRAQGETAARAARAMEALEITRDLALLYRRCVEATRQSGNN